MDKTKHIVLDFETRNTKVDIQEGLRKYLKTCIPEVLCYQKLDSNYKAIGDVETLEGVKEIKKHYNKYITDPKIVHWAYNATFDLQVMSKIFGDIDVRSWGCVSFAARVNGHYHEKNSLQEVSRREDLEVTKTTSSHTLRAWNRKKDVYQKEIIEYCQKDVLVTVKLLQKLKKLSFLARVEWSFCELINSYGIPIDKELATKGAEYFEMVKKKAGARIADLTDNWITTGTQNEKIKKYLKMFEGIHIDTFSNLVTTNFPEHVKELLSLREICNTKGSMFLNLKNAAYEGRIYGTLNPRGTFTGRYTASKVPIQCMPGRGTVSDTRKLQKLIDHFKAGKIPQEPSKDTITNIKNIVRPCIRTNGDTVLGIIDFTQIEPRTAAVLNQDKTLIELYKKGVDSYKALYTTDIEKIPIEKVTKEQRTLMKILGLSLMYGASGRRVQQLFVDNGITHLKGEQLVKSWREKNKTTVEKWWKLENEIRQAVIKKTIVDSSITGYKFDYSQKLKTAYIIFPDGEYLAMRNCRLEMDKIVYNNDTQIYGSKIFNSIIQGTAARVLIYSKLQLIKKGWKLIFSVHDEPVVEMKRDDPYYNLEQLKKDALIMPKWLSNIPLDCTGSISEFFYKD